MAVSGLEQIVQFKMYPTSQPHILYVASLASLLPSFLKWHFSLDIWMGNNKGWTQT